ncbi:aminoglycoside phosphotransferase [Alcanivorax xiamenensis]|uniref:Aminoglycoside phosphotransferase n=2 Tax=Alcanivoracaceae TaxID=224372 RepID=A0ABQ6Y6Q9_9GAMM|nr:aminoglycoside phosphotransferase [Alcanivorax xiamenensis]
MSSQHGDLMELNQENVGKALQALSSRLLPGAAIDKLTRLTGGASQQMWSFNLVSDDDVEPLILRIASPMNGSDSTTLTMDQEARLLREVLRHDVPVPIVRYELKAEDDLGVGYIMRRVDGETLPQRILRDEAYSNARSVLARQCGQVMAGIHQVPLDKVSFLRQRTAEQLIDTYYQRYQACGEPRPVFELAFRWLRDNPPSEPSEPCLVHGDFRNGNLMVDRNGLRVVLDWELSYLGDPMADLGWICVNSWRFGNSALPVGGFGTREELFQGYQEASGRRVDPGRVAFWEVFGVLKWGVICQKMAQAFISGTDRTVERGAIGRRASETEIDLLTLLAR